VSDEDEGFEGRVLVHVCCAGCAAEVAGELTRQGVTFEGYFYNPNIHPLLEFRRRLKSCRVLAEDSGLAMSFDEDYGLVEWLRAVVGREAERCELCYRMRLGRTAEVARERGFEGFSTTLLVSPHQRHDLLRRVGEETAARVGVKFVYRDWRGLHGKGDERTHGRKLYRQQYCGCIYSEYERYRDTTRHLWQDEEGR